MTSQSTRRWSREGVAAVCFGLVASPLVLMPPVAANPTGTGVVISEAYLNGGSTGATYTNKYVELYNPTANPVDLSGMSVQYRSATGTAGTTTTVPLTGSIPAQGHYLVQGSSNGAAGGALPTPDDTGGLNFAGASGTIVLANQTTPLTAADLPVGDSSSNVKVVDLLGYGTSNTFETTVDQGGNSVTSSLARTALGTDTNNNADDFTADAPTPENAGEPPVDPPDPTGKTIEEIQGTGTSSPLVGQSVTTRGVVTASYPTGGFKGVYIQTPGTGGEIDPATQTTSHGLFLYLADAPEADYPAVGDYVEATGPVSEFFGLTQVAPTTKSVTTLADTVTAARPAEVFWPGDETARESLEGMLLAPQGRYTVADNFALNQFGEIGLARGSKPLLQPTDVARPKSPEAAAVVAQNAARAVKVDDGATLNFLSTAKDVPLPYLTLTKPVRVGAAVTFTKPMVLDYRNSSWKFEPTEQLTGANADAVQPVTFDNTRTAHPEAVGGDLKIASFNVLNYFTETGTDWVNDGGTCSFFRDRANNPITVNSCNGDGPRGAATSTNRLRQQEKVVAAINSMGADVLSLEEIENSAKYAGDSRRDDALSTLVDALNQDALSQVWDYVRSPQARPTVGEEDVIRTAFIYKRAKVEPVGTSKILTNSPAFTNAREPLGQIFKPAGGTENQQFLVVVNHFKSKSSGSGPDADQGDGQGASNLSRVNQAKALVTFVNELRDSTGTEQVFLTGDFNAYTQEDPMQVLYDAGYTDIGAGMTDEATYLFGGVVGSLDHVLANQAGMAQVVGADVWNINSVESVAYEYSRYNYNATNLYAPNQYRSSDHDPLVVGIDSPAADDDVTVNLLNINDFHGRIDANTVGFAATVEKLRDAQGDASTLFMSAGDNIGASLFASATAQDIPTIDVLNALGLKSSVGNHEFDTGYADLTGRIDEATDWSYLGANVFKGNGDRALPAYDVFTANGLDVGVIGAVTAETPSLVTPAGIEGLEFMEPVGEVNKVADQLTDGNPANGEADVIVAEYHEGAAEGTPEGGTLERALAAGGAFAKIATETSPKVAAIFTGHTHKQYVWDGPVPGVSGKTRPIVQTGNYGENVGRVTITFDPTTRSVASYTAGLTKRLTVTDTNANGRIDAAEQTAFDDQMVASYGSRVQEVRTIVTSALAAANEVGKVPVGALDDDITTAFKNVTYGPDGATSAPANRDDRGSESTLGNLVADSLLDKLSDEPYQGGADIGLTNPGGLRAELLYAGTGNPDTDQDGVITFAEANAVLPFVNNLWTVKLTGAQFKQVLEQQWQTDVNGNVITSRPFQHLGLSRNVSTTLDESKPLGQRVTSVRVNGQPLDPAATYTIGTVSFLATGGDNFRAFKLGQGTDTGLVDRDAWIEYLQEHTDPPLAPAYDRRQVYGTGLPESIGAGDPVSFNLNRLNLTSLGSPENATVDVVLRTPTGDTPVDGSPFTVMGGTASVAFTAPADIPAGSTFVATARPSGTTVTLPATAVPEPVTTTTTASASPAEVVVRSTQATITAAVESSGQPVDGGTVNVFVDGSNLGTAAVDNGTATVQLPVFMTTGDKVVSVEYTGATPSESSTDTLTLTVVKADPEMTVEVGPAVIRKKKTAPTFSIELTAPGQTVTGDVSVVSEGETTVVTLVDGRATVTLPPYRSSGSYPVVVRYEGSDLANAVTEEVTVNVR